MSQQAFNNLRYKYICELLDILSSGHLRDASHIKRLFSERGEGYEEIVAFLIRLSIIADDNSQLRLRVDSEGRCSGTGKEEIMSRLLGNRNRYRTEMFRFLNQFRVVSGEMAYSPSDQSRSAESGVRNFLMELGILHHNMEEDRYVLVPEYASLLASAKDNTNYTSPSMLKANVIARDEIGFAAEEVIVDYERSRVGLQYSDKVDHISARNCGAGYDIRSVSVNPEGLIFPRLIEVKAVSPNNYKFYWSRNEVNVARALSNWYCLYLLPASCNGRFETEKLVVIEDPCNVVLSKSNNWITETDAMVCYNNNQTIK